MDSCDVVIIGGGPAGSACAWKLRNYGLDVMMLDREKFPREKACAGWVTPGAWQQLGVDPSEYAKGRVFQPIFGFRTSLMGGSVVETRYEHVLGYCVRRSEFDQFLIERAGVWLLDGEAVTSIERERDGWVVNKGMKASVVIGAGGHFCPVAQHLGATATTEAAVVARMAEVEASAEELDGCAVEPEMPEIYFCRDLQGYGWCLRKGNFLNFGLGRTDRKDFADHFSAFIGFLKKHCKIPSQFSENYKGHSYLLYGMSNRRIIDDGVLLIGDAAGVAYQRSGEGIRPAIESGLMAARTLLDAQGDFSRKRLEPYRQNLLARFTPSTNGRLNRMVDHAPGWMKGLLARDMLSSIRFSRRVVLNRWFLHLEEPPFTY